MAALEKDSDASKASKDTKNAKSGPRPKKFDRFHFAKTLANEGNLSQTATSFEDKYKKSLKHRGPDHDTTLYYQESWALVLHEIGKYGEAKDLNEKSITTRERTEGVSPPTLDFLQVHQNLAKNYEGLQNRKQATKLFRANYDWHRQHPQLGEDDEDTLRAGFDLAVSLHAGKDFFGAEDLNRKIFFKRRQIKAPESEIVISRAWLGSAQIKLGKFQTAKALFEKNIEVLKSQLSDKPLLAACEKYLAQCCEGLEAQENGKILQVGPVHQSSSEREAKIKHMKENAANYDKMLKERIESMKGKPKGKTDSTTDSSKNKNEVPMSNPKSDNQNQTTQKSLPAQGKPSDSPKPPYPRRPASVGNDQQKPKEEAQNLQPPQSALNNTRGTGAKRANIINVEFRPRPHSLSSAGPPASVSKDTTSSNKPALLLAQANKKPNDPSESFGSPGKTWHSSTNSNYVPTIKEPAAQPTSDVPRTKSVSANRDKLSPSTRPRSASPNPAQTAAQRLFQPPLFDAKEGELDAASTHAVDGWFYDLQSQTQELLKPLRRDRISRRVRIAILDSGIDLTHPKFLNNQSKRIRRINTVEDFLDPGGTGQDACGHGTHCVGLLRQVAPEADIYVARVVKGSEGKLDPNVIAKAINRASRSGTDENGVKNWDVDIISMSCGFYSWVEVVKDAINEALMKPKRPVLIFAAASNNGTRKKVAFPAYLTGVICVNSATADGRPSDFNPPFDATRSFSILGENVSSTWLTSEKEERRMSGTSVATPIAAATAALLLEFALQTDPSDEVTDKVLKDQLERLQGYHGIIEIFNKMSEKGGMYRNIVPWNVLSVDYDREDVARMIKVEMTKAFGKTS